MCYADIELQEFLKLIGYEFLLSLYLACFLTFHYEIRIPIFAKFRSHVK